MLSIEILASMFRMHFIILIENQSYSFFLDISVEFSTVKVELCATMPLMKPMHQLSVCCSVFPIP